MTNRHFTIPYRILYLGIGVAVFLAAYYIGAAAIKLTVQDAQTVRDEFTKQVQDIDQEGIFLNNVEIGLVMFMPGAGAGLGIYSGISTGIVFNAFAQASPELAALSPLSVFGSAYGIIEALAYGLAISRSGMLVVQLAQKSQRTGWKRYTLYTGIEIAIVITALIAASAIETQAIAK